MQITFQKRIKEIEKKIIEGKMIEEKAYYVLMWRKYLRTLFPINEKALRRIDSIYDRTWLMHL